MRLACDVVLALALAVAVAPASPAAADGPPAPGTPAEPGEGPAPAAPDRGAAPAAEAAAAPAKREHDVTARALERALVRQGALVLLPWSLELEPGVEYAYRETDALRRDTVAATLAARLGLPLGAQADVRLPYVVDHASRIGARHGVGDARLGLSKQLLVGSPGSSSPDVLLTVRWKSTTGASAGELAPGTGNHALDALATVVRRDDPLVMIGTAYYVWNLPAHGVDRGDAAGVVLAALLAATPYTSALFGVDVATVAATRIHGASVPGTDRLAGVLNLGLYTAVTRSLFANVTASVGITPAAPPLQLTVSLPLRL